VETDAHAVAHTVREPNGSRVDTEAVRGEFRCCLLVDPPGFDAGFDVVQRHLMGFLDRDERTPFPATLALDTERPGQVAVVAFQLLLGTQLDTEVGNLAFTALTVLAGAIFTTVYWGFWTAPDVFTHAAVNFVLGSCAFGHGCSPFNGPGRIAKGQ
jgi:hypothetical protein